MGLHRYDGSVEYTTLINTHTVRNYGIYRCQITSIQYIDNPSNFTMGSSNPEVTYSAIIIGGTQDGRILRNIRNAAKTGGGQYNTSETILTANQQDYQSDTNVAVSPSNQIGDVIYVAFVDGDYGFPIIIGYDNHFSSKVPQSMTVDGPRKIETYNGVTESIDNTGTYLVEVNGGSIVQTQFIPNSSGITVTADPSEDEYSISTKGGATIVINGESTQVTVLDGSGGELKINSGKVTLLDSSGGELNIAGGKVALGSSSAELLNLFNETLSQINTLLTTFTSNASNFIAVTASPGSPSPLNPVIVSSITSIDSQIESIQSSLEQIKGSL